MEQDKEQDTDGKPEPGSANESVYYYGDSGIEERHGHVPLWLWAVAAALLAWGIYYLAAYWTPPA